MTFKTDWLRHHTYLYLENSSWIPFEAAEFLPVFLCISGLFLSQNLELCHIVWLQLQFSRSKLPLERRYVSSASQVRRFDACTLMFSSFMFWVMSVCAVYKVTHLVVMIKLTKRSHPHSHEQFSFWLQVIHLFKHPATTQPTNFSDSISLKKSLNWTWFIPFDVTKLPSFKTNVTALISLRDLVHRFSWWSSSCKLSNRDSFYPSRRGQ